MSRHNGLRRVQRRSIRNMLLCDDEAHLAKPGCYLRKNP